MGDAPRSKVGMVVRGGLLVLIGVALFDIPAAFLASRDYSPWLSLAAGLLTFPLLSLAWHLFAEHGRKQTESKKPALTKGWERWLMRSAAVGIVVVGALVAAAGAGRVWSAFRTHALWFVPDGAGALSADSKLFDQVPPNAEAILWVRFDDDARAALGKVLPKSAEVDKVLSANNIVLAINDDGVFLAETGDTGAIAVVQSTLGTIEEMVKGLAPDLAYMLKSTTGTASDGTRYLVTEGWKDQVGKGKPTDLIASFSGAPDDAWLVLVARPADTKKSKAMTSGVVWSRVHRGRLLLEGRGDFASLPDATNALNDIKQGLAAQEMEACWKYVHSGADQSGTTVTFSLAVNVDELEALSRCLD